MRTRTGGADGSEATVAVKADVSDAEQEPRHGPPRSMHRQHRAPQRQQDRHGHGKWEGDSAFMNLDLDGGGDSDLIQVHYAGGMDGSLRVEARGGLGDDGVQVEATLLAGSRGQYGPGGEPALVEGNLGKDTLIHAVRNEGNASVFAKVDGGAGKDSSQRTANVTGISVETDAVTN